MLLDGLVGMLAVVGAAVLFPNHQLQHAEARRADPRGGRGLADRRGDQPGLRADQDRRRRRRDAGGASGPSSWPSPPGPCRPPSPAGMAWWRLCVMATPIAGLASLVVRFAARKHLHHQQRDGRNVRRVIVVGSAYAAADLHAVLTREPHCGMQVIGVCVPQADIAAGARRRADGDRRSRPGAGPDQDLRGRRGGGDRRRRHPAQLPAGAVLVARGCRGRAAGPPRPGRGGRTADAHPPVRRAAPAARRAAALHRLAPLHQAGHRHHPDQPRPDRHLARAGRSSPWP